MRGAAIARRAAIILVGLGLGLVATEIILRLFHLAPAAGIATMTESDFERLPGIFAPHQRVIDHRNPALPHVIRIDSLGYRGDDFPRAKPNGELRILMVGDSFTYGDFVDNDATLPAQLAERLQRACGAVRVVNAGLGGSTIIEQREMLRRALPLQPDLVVLTFAENDVADLARRPMWEELAENRRAKSRLPLSVIYPVLHNTALWNLAMRARGAMRARQGPEATPQLTALDTDSSTAALREQYMSQFHGLQEALAAARIPFALALFPSHHAVTSAAQRGQLAWALEGGVRSHVPTISLLTALQASRLPVTDLYLLPHDGHPSARGYAVAADSLAAFLKRLPALRTRCSAP
jgi:lysophospholipase L1-like esterase